MANVGREDRGTQITGIASTCVGLRRLEGETAPRGIHKGGVLSRTWGPKPEGTQRTGTNAPSRRALPILEAKNWTSDGNAERTQGKDQRGL